MPRRPWRRNSSKATVQKCGVGTNAVLLVVVVVARDVRGDPMAAVEDVDKIPDSVVVKLVKTKKPNRRS